MFSPPGLLKPKSWSRTHPLVCVYVCLSVCLRDSKQVRERRRERESVSGDWRKSGMCQRYLNPRTLSVRCVLLYVSVYVCLTSSALIPCCHFLQRVTLSPRTTEGWAEKRGERGGGGPHTALTDYIRGLKIKLHSCTPCFLCDSEDEIRAQLLFLVHTVSCYTEDGEHECVCVFTTDNTSCLTVKVINIKNK